MFLGITVYVLWIFWKSVVLHPPKYDTDLSLSGVCIERIPCRDNLVSYWPMTFRKKFLGICKAYTNALVPNVADRSFHKPALEM